MSAEEIVMRTGTAAFSRGPEGTITAWNEAAETLMALPAEKALGRRCHEVMGGRDVFGNDYCGLTCSCRRMAAEEKRIHPIRLTETGAGGRPMGLRISILPAHGPNGPELVHLLEPAMGAGALGVFSDELDDDEPPPGLGRGSLTRRVLDVLRHLVVGYGTEEIADRLMISPNTVRSHISQCLQKLDAHSRVEAVGVARRLDLV